MTTITSTATENDAIVLHVPKEKSSFNVPLYIFFSSFMRLRNEWGNVVEQMWTEVVDLRRKVVAAEGKQK